jgi:hypothetical protein
VYLDDELIQLVDMVRVSPAFRTYALLDIAGSFWPLRLRVDRAVGGAAVGSICSGWGGSVNFCLFPPRVEGGLFSSGSSVGLEARRAGAFRFLEVVAGGLGVETDVVGCEEARGVEVAETPDSAASLAEERVTLRDMSDGSHQEVRTVR